MLCLWFCLLGRRDEDPARCLILRQLTDVFAGFVLFSSLSVWFCSVQCCSFLLFSVVFYNFVSVCCFLLRTVTSVVLGSFVCFLLSFVVALVSSDGHFLYWFVFCVLLFCFVGKQTPVLQTAAAASAPAGLFAFHVFVVGFSIFSCETRTRTRTRTRTHTHTHKQNKKKSENCFSLVSSATSLHVEEENKEQVGH